jgi:hypothetical protein
MNDILVIVTIEGERRRRTDKSPFCVLFCVIVNKKFIKGKEKNKTYTVSHSKR